MEQQLSDILKNYEDLKQQVYDFITNTEHFIFYWIEEGEVKSFIKKNPDNYEELIKLSVVSISDTSAWVIIHLPTANNLTTRCDFGLFKEYTLYQWEKFNGQLKQHRIRQVKNEINYYKQKLAENEELLKGLTKPNFKVDDWVVSNGQPALIHELKTNYYLGKYLNGHDFCHKYTDEDKLHLWTIQDAKDGDILYFNDDTIVVFKDLYNSSTFHSYCHIEDGVFDISKDEMPDWWEGKGFKPATKEQRDLFFAKMKEVGYVWDSDKKELHKI